MLVTGATSGIGEAMARSFADLGAVVHVHGRNADKLAGVARQLRLDRPAAEVVEEVCDVGDLDAVRAWADDFAGRVPELHGLVHNAGTMTEEREESPQGHELALAVHVLGPHLVTELLQDRLAAAGGASVVWMSSGGMYGARLPSQPEDIEYRRGDYKGVQAYARTKRMQVVLADAWATRLASRDVRVESMHPGWVETPGVATHLPTFNMISQPRAPRRRGRRRHGGLAGGDPAARRSRPTSGTTGRSGRHVSAGSPSRTAPTCGGSWPTSREVTGTIPW